jgi:branched-chain amino acid aminotransferase
LIWRDGALVPWREANIHIMSHAVHYGSSVFEGIRCYETRSGPAIFRLPEHIRRLMDSAKIYRMPLRYSAEDLIQACKDTVTKNGLSFCYLRPIALRTGEEMGVFGSNASVEVFVIPKVWGRYLGAEAVEQGVDVKVSSWRRPAPNTFPTMAKAGGNYLNAQLAKMEARADGYTEGIMLDVGGLVAEGSGENLFLVRENILYTAPLSAGILNGITRDSVTKLAGTLEIPVIQQEIPREMLYIADELFFTGTAAEITPIRSVDRIPIGIGKRGPVTQAIQDEFFGITSGTKTDSFGWLTHL